MGVFVFLVIAAVLLFAIFTYGSSSEDSELNWEGEPVLPGLPGFSKEYPGPQQYQSAPNVRSIQAKAQKRGANGRFA